ncbi:hypothetical protein M0805_002137 [Coniferiporia weirii]|nr:hypothetical protein M0805_002137 [Coniferiporia weirii]
MGVHGLTTFLRENKRSLSKTLLFSAQEEGAVQTALVVDGWSFIYKLLHDSNLPWVYGGEYDEYAQLVVKVVAAWLKVGLRPVFVFDGSTPPEKFATVASRLNQSHVQQALLFFRTSAASRNTRRFLNETRIIPPLAYTVCVHALLTFRYDSSGSDAGSSGDGGDANALKGQLEVHFADEEGDPYAVELAGHLEGYVCGRDSDFVVLNSDGYRGYIPLDELMWLASDDEAFQTENDLDDGFQAVKSKKKLGSENIAGVGIIPPDSGVLSLSASLYTPASLAHHMNLPVSLLPLLGALVGNDYTLQAPPSTSSANPKPSHSLLFERRMNPSQRIRHASATLGTFLRPPPGKRKQKTPQSVMELIQMTVAALLGSNLAPASLIGSGQQAVIVESVVEGTLPYAISARPDEDAFFDETVCVLHSPLECRLVSILDRTDPDLPAHTADVAALYLRAYRQGKFSPSLMDVLSTQTFWPELFLENPDVESVSRSVSRPVREFAYALLENGIGVPSAEYVEESEESDMQEGTETEEYLDEMIDVVEEESEESDYEDDISADVGKLRGALRGLQLDEEEVDNKLEHSVTEESSVQSSSAQSPSVRSPIPLSRLIYPKKPVDNRRKVVTEYIRRGTRVVTEEITIPALRQLLVPFHIGDGSVSEGFVDLPLQLRPETERTDALFRFLQVDPQTMGVIDRNDLMPILSLRLVVRRMHERATETESKERQFERWTRTEARVLLASLASPKSESATSADPLQEVSERAIQLTAQLSTALECIEHLVQILLLTDAVPGCAHRLSGLRFHTLLASSADTSAGVAVDECIWHAVEGGLEECFAEERTGKKAKRKARKAAAAIAVSSSNSSLNGKSKILGAGGMYSLLASMSA